MPKQNSPGRENGLCDLVDETRFSTKREPKYAMQIPPNNTLQIRTIRKGLFGGVSIDNKSSQLIIMSKTIGFFNISNVKEKCKSSLTSLL